jgi:hypothetical protein
MLVCRCHIISFFLTISAACTGKVPTVTLLLKAGILSNYQPDFNVIMEGCYGV